MSHASSTIDSHTFYKRDIITILHHSEHIYRMINDDDSSVESYMYLATMIPHSTIIHLVQHDRRDIVCWIVNVFRTLQDRGGLKYINKAKLNLHIRDRTYRRLLHLGIDPQESHRYDLAD